MISYSDDQLCICYSTTLPSSQYLSVKKREIFRKRERSEIGYSAEEKNRKTTSSLMPLTTFVETIVCHLIKRS
jgi:hypothetical protein